MTEKLCMICKKIPLINKNSVSHYSLTKILLITSNIIKVKNCNGGEKFWDGSLWIWGIEYKYGVKN